MSLSIIVPVYNEEKYLKDTLEKIRDQKFKDYELIVVCNGCSDKSFNIAKKYADKAFSLKEKNVSKAKNFGAENAKYSKLIFLDADVFIEDGVLDAINALLGEESFFGTTKGRGKGIKNNLYLRFKNMINPYWPWSHGLVFCGKE
ncbi:MAG: glycosyltransferase family A protein, partial [Nanoarchaeota archaeon]